MGVYQIRYQYGTYSGERTIVADNSEQAIARMWAGMRRRGELTLPMAYQSAKVLAELPEPDGEAAHAAREGCCIYHGSLAAGDSLCGLPAPSGSAPGADQ